MNIEFEDWLREKHLKDCPECQRKGKASLTDYYVSGIHSV